MRRDVESQLTAFARALEDAAAEIPEHAVLNAGPPQRLRRAGVVFVVSAVVVLAAMVVPLLSIGEEEPSTGTTAITTPSTSVDPTDRVEIPDSGWAILGRYGIRRPDGLLIWHGLATAEGRMARDGAGGLVFTDRHGLWWLRPGSTGPVLVTGSADELVEVVVGDAVPVARLGQCPSTYVALPDGRLVGDLGERRVRIDCSSGTTTWRADSGLTVALGEPDGSGIIWLEVIEFDLTVVRLPVGGPQFPSVRIEDFDGRYVMFSRGASDRSRERVFFLVDLLAGTVEVIPAWGEEGAGALLGMDAGPVSGLLDIWAPSQQPARAMEDGLPADLARLPLAVRSEPWLQVQLPEGEWRVSRLGRGFLELASAWGTGIPGTTWSTWEYGELLVIDEQGAVVKAFPFPGSPLGWFAATGDHVYAGRVGDGALPDSALVRIDRSTWEVEVVVFQIEERYQRDWPSDWAVVEWGSPLWDRYEELVNFGEPSAGGTLVESWIGPVYVDLEGVDSLIDAASR